LVDSGADYVTVPATVGQLLGFDLATLPTERVVAPDGNHYALYRADVTMLCQGKSFALTVLFNPGRGFGYSLLGRRGLFEQLLFAFDEQAKVLLVRR